MEYLDLPKPKNFPSSPQEPNQGCRNFA